MHYKGTLLAVKNIAAAKEFYVTVLKQTIVMDLVTHVTLENGLSLQEGFYELLHLPDQTGPDSATNFQLYFEVDTIDSWAMVLSKREEVAFVHKLQAYPWGQRSMRIYDCDGHIIEIAENMDCVIQRLLEQGLTAEEVAKQTMYPVDYVNSLQ